MKLLEGYVENRTKEAALAAVLIALTLISKQITLPIFVWPLYGLEPSIVFWSLSIIVLSYPYVVLLALLIPLFGTIGILGFPTLITGFTIFYFICKLVGLKWAPYLTFFASNINGVVWLAFWGPLILGPNVASLKLVFLVPVLIKCTTQGILAVITVPLLLKTLKIYEGEKR